MSENVRARDLMRSEFVSIRVDDRLRAAMVALIELQERPDLPNALVVNDAEGRYVSVLSARLLARSLLADWSPTADQSDEGLEADVMANLRGRLDDAVGDVLISDLPHVDPDARLLLVIRASCERKLEFLPVVEDGRAVGLIPVTAIFDATASLVLTPEDEGIRFDQDV